LVLFDPEIELFKKLIPKEQATIEEPETLTREERGKIKSLQIEIDQKLSTLKQMQGDMQREKTEFLKNRVLMIKRYYTNVIYTLKNHSFEEAGEEYLKIAQMMSKRQDFKPACLMILLHGLCFLKADKSLSVIQSNVSSFLDSLGLHKKLLQDTFYIRCIQLILDVKLNKLDLYLMQIQELMDVLPLFDEEKDLIQSID
jgi:hypothetical protein